MHSRISTKSMQACRAGCRCEHCGTPENRPSLLEHPHPSAPRRQKLHGPLHRIPPSFPRLSTQLAEFAVNCPPSLKLRDGWSKWILRNATVDTLPDKVRLRKTKLGFNTPEAEWMRLGLQNGHRKLWDTPKIRMERFLSAEALSLECRKFLHGSRGALPASSIFRAISVELWAQVHSVS